MSSSHHQKKRRESHSTTYPTTWSDWEWDTERSRLKRWRHKRPGRKEWEWEKLPETPRNSTAIESLPENNGPEGTEESQESHYTTSVEDLTQNLESTSLNQPEYAANSQAFEETTPSQPIYEASSRFPIQSQSGWNTHEQTRSYSVPPSISQSGWAGPSTFNNYTSPGLQQYGTPGAHPPLPIQAKITTRNPGISEEKFDPHYKVQRSKEFTWGRVFKVLWTEPDGGNANGNESDGTVSVRFGKFGQKTYSKVRRFVIINTLEGHSVCLPINTYSGQGVRKKGVKAKHHTIIWSEKGPVMFKGEREKGLTRQPIRMEASSPRHKLDRASRLNYAKIYTVEHNVKVWFIGEVHQESCEHLVADYNEMHPLLTAPTSNSISEDAPYDETPYQEEYARGDIHRAEDAGLDDEPPADHEYADPPHGDDDIYEA